VTNTVEIVDHKDDIQDVNKTMKLIVGLLLVLVVKRRRDPYHAMQTVETYIGA